MSELEKEILDCLDVMGARAPEDGWHESAKFTVELLFNRDASSGHEWAAIVALLSESRGPAWHSGKHASGPVYAGSAVGAVIALRNSLLSGLRDRIARLETHRSEAQSRIDGLEKVLRRHPR